MVVLVVVGEGAGAQRSFDARAVTARLPNWSFSWIVGSVAAGQWIL